MRGKQEKVKEKWEKEEENRKRYRETGKSIGKQDKVQGNRKKQRKIGKSRGK